MDKGGKILVAGGSGLVGSAILRKLKEKGYTDLTATYHTKNPNDNEINWIKTDLTNQRETEKLFETTKPDYVFLAAAKVGGIWANNVYRAEFIHTNLQIQNNVIHNSYKFGVKKLLFLGSTCIYPKNCPQPIKEEYLLTDILEFTNEPYAIAKISGIKMCESYNLQYGTNFISVMPTNLYGYNDNFDLEKSHVLPALLRKIHLGKALEEKNWEEIKKDLNKNPIEGISGKNTQTEILNILKKYGITEDNGTIFVEIWGSGKPKREFLWSEDMADACVFLMEKTDFKDIVKLKFPEINDYTDPKEYAKKEIRNTHINIGTGEDISIKQLAETIKNIVGFKGNLFFNTSKPDGTFRKLTDVSTLHSLGWKHKTSLEKGIEKLYAWYLNTVSSK